MNGIRCFELLEDLLPNGTAKAVLLVWNGSDYVRSTQTIVIHDFVSSHGDRGDRGYAFQSSESKNWESLSGLFQRVPGWVAI
ncbi:MAG: hypothetical protein V4719_14475 [Planctomycetota bacterium]